ncbi:MAG: cadherin-like domain-containing protein, partial [Pseudomonadota bacterium]
MTISDDFSGGILDPVWLIAGPGGTSVTVGADATDAYLELVTPDGNHDVWNANNGARALQAITDTDFDLETRFLTTPSDQYQLQGFLIEEDAQNWVRFDTYSDGSNLRAFGAVTVNGVSSPEFNVVIPGGEAPYLQLSRDGDLWTFRYSTDGQNWVTAGSFSHALTATSAGLFAGNVGGATGFVARADYFETAADPIVGEDGGAAPVNVAPEAADDAFAAEVDGTLIIDVADLLANDTDANGDVLSLAGFTQPANGTLVENGNGTLTYTPDAGYAGTDSFGYTTSDGALSDSATVTLTVAPPPPPPTAAISDDFAGGVLNGVW